MTQKKSAPPMILQQKLSKLKQNLSNDKQTYESALNLNQTLKTSLNLFNANLQTKIKPEHYKLFHQRKAIYQLLSYDKKVSLKQNYLHFYNQFTSKKHQLTKILSKQENKHKELNQKAMNFNQQLQETNQIKNSMKQDKIRIQKHLSQLEQQKIKKITIKCALQQQWKINSNVKFYPDHQISQQHNLSDFDSFEEQQVFSQLNSSNISKKDNKISQNSITNKQKYLENKQSIGNLFRQNKSKSFDYHQDTFTNAHQIFDGLQVDSKPKSKQILNSLQKQLNPLKLNQFISYLQSEIDHLKKSQLQKLLKDKNIQEKKKQFLQDKENHVNNKLEKIKTHIKNFKHHKFPNLRQLSQSL